MWCKGSSVYVDLGTNVGSQVHKLYNPDQCRSPVQPLFGLLGDRRSVCTLMVEPNPAHVGALNAVATMYTPMVRLMHGLASTYDGTGSFFRNPEHIDGAHHDDWTGSELQQHPNQNASYVRRFDVSRILKELADKKVGMKIDVEGSEEWLLPHLMKENQLCNLAFVYIEVHNQNALGVYERVADQLRKRRCPVRLVQLDDESACPPLTRRGTPLRPKQQSRLHAPSRCIYAFGSNTTIGGQRLRKLDNQMKAQNVQYEAFTARTAPASWSVPCLAQPGAHIRGYVGMWLSMLHLWRRGQERCAKEWLILLESDAVLPQRFDSLLARHAGVFEASDIVWLDARTGTGAGASGCCTVGMAYRVSALRHFVQNFDPRNTSAYWNDYARKEKPKVNDPTCLTDWYLGNLAAYLKLRSNRLGIVQHPKSASEIAFLG